MVTETAMFAAGCFWGVEAHFAALAGVAATEVGYSGGETRQPTYRQGCSGATGHAEEVRDEFAPGSIGYGQLPAAFRECHDPTQLHPSPTHH